MWWPRTEASGSLLSRSPRDILKENAVFSSKARSVSDSPLRRNAGVNPLAAGSSRRTAADADSHLESVSRPVLYVQWAELGALASVR